MGLGPRGESLFGFGVQGLGVLDLGFSVWGGVGTEEADNCRVSGQG